MQVSTTLSVNDPKIVSSPAAPTSTRVQNLPSFNSLTNASLAPDLVTFTTPFFPIGAPDRIQPADLAGNTPDLTSNIDPLNVDDNDGDSRPLPEGESGDSVMPVFVDRGVGNEESGKGGSRQESRSRPSSDADQNADRLTPQEQEIVQELAARDAEVKAHERAHQATGGQYAGAISYTYQQGPDGKRYAIGGTVPIDVAPVSGDPQATIDKMRIVRSAALAPVKPSAQDRSVAATAQRLLIDAQIELAEEKRQERIETQERLSTNNKQTNRAIQQYEDFIGLGVVEVDPKDLIDELV